MNLPMMPPGGQQPPGGYQQPQQAAYPQPAAQPGGQQHLQAAGNANVSASLMREAYTPGNRQKIDDGEHIVQITLAEVRNSQAGGGQFLLVEYTVLQSQVPAAVGQTYGHAFKWGYPWQVDECCDLYKRLFGEEAAAQLAVQRPGIETVVQQCLNALQQWTQQQSLYAKLIARRSQKKLREGVPYAEVYPNHTFLEFGFQPPELKAATAPAGGLPGPGQMPMPAQPAPATGALPPSPQPMGPPNPAAQAAPGLPQPGAPGGPPAPQMPAPQPQQPQYQQPPVPQPQPQPQPQYQQPGPPQMPAPQQPQAPQMQPPPVGGPPPMHAFGQ